MDRRVVGVVVAVTALRVLHAGWIGLSEDEAYYWVWGQHLAAGYFDHPPVIAWIIRLGTTVLGDTERGVRLVGLLLGGLVAWMAAGLSKDRLLAALLMLSTPILLLGNTIATPDVPLVATWVAALLAAHRQRWGWVGVACGMAMLSKYTGVLLLPLLLAAQPRALRHRGPYVAILVAGLVYLPNVIWNLQHDLISWRFQLNHVSETPSRLAFLGAQWVLGGPLLAPVALCWWCIGWRGSSIERLCWWTSLPLVAVATWAGGEANWAAPAWASVGIGLACSTQRWHRAAWVGMGINMAFGMFAMTHAVKPLVDLPADPVHRLQGGDRLADSVAAWGMDAVYTERYQEAALIHFYSGIPAHAMPGIARPDQYDLWPVSLSDHALFVRVHRGGTTMPFDDLGYTWRDINNVVAYAPTTDPVVDVPIARWNVIEIRRPETEATSTPP